MRRSPTNSQAVAQLNLVHEDIDELIRSLVNAMGGAKVIGPRLYPQKSPDAAARYLHDCLNPNRDHDIGARGLLTLLKWARESSIHFGMEWICDEIAYTRPSPIEPEDSMAELQREYIRSIERQDQICKRMERLAPLMATGRGGK